MTLELLAPLAGTVVALADVPDETFAAEILGPGIAIEPEVAVIVRVVAPCAGRLSKVHPHAVALEVGELGVIVHLGIDTVSLHGRGYEVLVADGETVEAGQELIRWDVSEARLSGLAAVTPLVVFSHRPLAVASLVAPGAEVAAGAPLLHVD